MNGSPEFPDQPANPQQRAPARPADDDPRRNILVVDMDRDLLGLLEEWLGAAGMRVAADSDGVSRPAACDLVIIDLPNPRHARTDRLHRIGRDHPGVPVIALSSTFFPGIDCTGGVARALGVACALPKPVSRESLINAVRDLLDR